LRGSGYFRFLDFDTLLGFLLADDFAFVVIDAENALSTVCPISFEDDEAGIRISSSGLPSGHTVTRGFLDWRNSASSSDGKSFCICRKNASASASLSVW
jgi:hypothetical protein